MDKKLLNDEQLGLISGGVLVEGWDTTLLAIMKIFKEEYGEEGQQKVRDLMSVSLNDPTSPIEESDMQTLYDFIDSNWNNI